ncbi:MAG: alpha/beta fold hydrolase, partial [Polyangiales bacterium]
NSGGLFRRNLLTKLVTRAFARFFGAGARGASWFPRAFAAYYRMVLSQPAARAQRDRIVARAREVAPLLEAAWRSFGEEREDLRPLVERVECPVLVSWAMGDRFNPLWASMPAIRRFREVRVVKHRAGHNPFLEDAPGFLEAYRAFAT